MQGFESEDEDEDDDYEREVLKAAGSGVVGAPNGAAPPSFAPSEVDVLANLSKTRISTGVDVKKAQESSASGDQIALDAFETFCAELQEWCKDKTAVANEDVRGDYCDHLTDKYLANSLDVLDSSAVVSQVRKLISHAVEQFASEGTLPADVTAHFTETEAKGSTHDKKSNFVVKSEGMKNMKGTAVKSNGGSSTSSTSSNKKSIGFAESVAKPAGSGVSKVLSTDAAVAAAATAKSELEKAKIKAQYQQFMKLRKKNEEHPDAGKAAELSDLNDDIQALLSSIQKT